jgi:glutamate formiminotransferase / formiminotetrahydrofolate cyclodeaminase
MRLIECVPNISEGKNDQLIDDVVQAAASSGAKILDVDRGRSTNRTVITFAAGPEVALEGAFRLIKRASELIDMSRHKGEHPRIGATDVCPFVPLENVSMQECAELARKLGIRVWEDLGIPVYLYAEAASSEARRSLSYLRTGEYEGIPAKLKDPAMRPDFGEPRFNEKSGITVIGARPFLIAYNVNLNSREKRLAAQMAGKIRESGVKKKDRAGNFVTGENGLPLVEPGLFKQCGAVGWFIEEYGIAQVSINLYDFEVTPMQAVFDACCRLAEERGLRVTGSELVGLVPKKALIMAGEHYLRKQSATTALPEKDLLFFAVKSLGLSELAPFKIEEKVIEEKVKAPSKLLSLNVTDFIDSVSRDTPAPGGGSVAALLGSLGAALPAMVAGLTFAKVTEPEKRAELERLGKAAQDLKAKLVWAVEEDTQAFDKVIAAFRIKVVTPEEKTGKDAAINAAYREATLVPLKVCRLCADAMQLAFGTLKSGLASAYSDSAVGIQAARAGLLGASYNVKINIKELKNRPNLSQQDRAFISTTEEELEEILESGAKLLGEAEACINQVLA